MIRGAAQQHNYVRMEGFMLEADVYLRIWIGKERPETFTWENMVRRRSVSTV
jgi:hypothetical protein